ncbi:L-galactose dehydrogenase [Colletotrichum sojae]|uniref:L-galactose dehydrogenase n=1 Tax=Colletotrichum sojae TaxID=2175907 RepID=A0A8H6IQL6_9PEZI|nr:L-galactose dehydrogenase [Colletotrichum sojae]
MVYVTIDAVDETENRKDLLDVLRKLATDQRFAKIRLLVTSREHRDIALTLMKISAEIRMHKLSLLPDIKLYVETRLQREPFAQTWSSDLRREAAEAMVYGAEGMFQLVVCQFDLLRRIKGTPAAIRQKLRRLPERIEGVYDRIFEQISVDDFPIVILVLKWICFDQQMLITGGEGSVNMNVLTEAIAEELVTEVSGTENWRVDRERIRECCGCLITVDRHDCAADRYSELVGLANYTVLEYLQYCEQNRPDTFFFLGQKATIEDRAAIMLQRALKSNAQDLEEIKSFEDYTANITNLSLPTFSSYCIVNILRGIRLHQEYFAENPTLFPLVTKLLDPRRHHYRWFIRILRLHRDLIDLEYCGVSWNAVPDNASGVLLNLLMAGCCQLSTKLMAAYEGNNMELLGTQLDLKFDPTFFPVNLGRTWTSRAPVVDVLLLLSLLISEQEVSRFLLRSGWKFNRQNTLLFFALVHDARHTMGDTWCLPGDLECSFQQLLKLVGSDVVNTPDCYTTPLQIAVAMRDPSSIKLLLQAGANPNTRGSSTAGAWPLDHALSEFNGFRNMWPEQILELPPPKILSGYANKLEDKERETRELL